MSVWFAMVASLAFMFLISPQYEFGTGIRIILAIVHSVTFICGMIYDDNRNDRIKKLEKEVAKLKDNVNS